MRRTLKRKNLRAKCGLQIYYSQVEVYKSRQAGLNQFRM
jgi:hypothetical protein